MHGHRGQFVGQGAAQNGGIARRGEDNGDCDLNRLIGGQITLPGQATHAPRDVTRQLNLCRGSGGVLRAGNLAGQCGRLTERGWRLEEQPGMNGRFWIAARRR